MFIKIASWTGVLEHFRSALKRDLRETLQPMRGDIEGLQKHLQLMQKQLDAGHKRVDGLRKQLDHAEATIAELAEQSARADRIAAQTKSILRLNEAHRDLLARVDAVLDEMRIVAHVEQAIAAAPLQTDPYPHIIVENLFPKDFYDLLRKAIPPPAFFGDLDPIKQNLKTPIEFGPELSVRVLGFLEAVIARRTMPPALMHKFHEPLQVHYDVIFGAAFRDRANAMTQSITGGRLMLRRPGYHLPPHRDPKRSMLTCLMYFAGSKDSDAYGTDIFRAVDDREATYTQTYYPEQNGSRCELVKRVPFRPNTMLVFLNSTGAHGATIPDDAPATLERYSYQCYIGPSQDAIGELIKDLAPERQAMWRSKGEVKSEYA
ncbi:MAG: hypothetical protein EXQ48_01170 [Acidobacteria bacterium]|nr:hypothetical protein [Acidobacteriota bacterium]